MRFVQFTSINKEQIAVDLDAVTCVTNGASYRIIALNGGNTVNVTESMDEIMADVVPARAPAAPTAPVV